MCGFRILRPGTVFRELGGFSGSFQGLGSTSVVLQYGSLHASAACQKRVVGLASPQLQCLNLRDGLLTFDELFIAELDAGDGFERARVKGCVCSMACRFDCRLRGGFRCFKLAELELRRRKGDEHIDKPLGRIRGAIRQRQLEILFGFRIIAAFQVPPAFGKIEMPPSLIFLYVRC